MTNVNCECGSFSHDHSKFKKWSGHLKEYNHFLGTQSFCMLWFFPLKAIFRFYLNKMYSKVFIIILNQQNHWVVYFIIFSQETIFVFICSQTFSAFYDFQHSFFVTTNFMWLDIFFSHCFYGSALAQFKFGSVTQLCPTLSNPWTCSTPGGFAVCNQFQELAQTQVHRLVTPSNHHILCLPLGSCLQSFLASEIFPMSQFFISGGRSIGITASGSVLPLNIQNWFPLGWTGWTSLQSKGLSRVFSNTVQKHQFFSAQLSL